MILVSPDAKPGDLLRAVGRLEQSRKSRSVVNGELRANVAKVKRNATATVPLSKRKSPDFNRAVDDLNRLKNARKRSLAGVGRVRTLTLLLKDPSAHPRESQQ